MTDYIIGLDSILQAIREETLTTAEIDTIKPIDPLDNQEKYQILNNVLKGRGGGQSLNKLKNNAEVNGITIDSPKKDYSNVLIGGGIL
jgi:hypothetical protein